jgi:hypothetical protein
LFSRTGIGRKKLLSLSEALTRLLPPARNPPPAYGENDPNDPRERMLQIYMQMRERGEIPDEGTLQAKINEQAAELERLKAAPDIPTMLERVPAPAANVVPLSRPNPSAVPAYDYNTQRGWRDHVLPDGSIRT